jgi:wyosine [tRNA(Phe)-imidazoG37] synthetase (radical SAM superfamily)
VSEKRVTHRHDRAVLGRRFVYVVRSRRSGGLSVGINLDPQQTCNFDCVYCEVIDRRAIARHVGRPSIEIADVLTELSTVLASLHGGAETLRDVAFAGDGEPSTFAGFLPLARGVFDAREAAGLSGVPVILITNGSGLGRTEMREAHDLFAGRGGHFWIKLDAGTEPFYRAVCRTTVPFERVLANLADAARRHPVVVQSMFFQSVALGAPTPVEIEAWTGRLEGVVRDGGSLAGVHVYTVARETMETGVHPISAEALEEIARAARRVLHDVPVETFP